MMNMKLLAVLTPPSIYHGCSTWKTFWEEKFLGEEKLFSAVNMKTVCSRMKTMLFLTKTGLKENHV